MKTPCRLSLVVGILALGAALPMFAQVSQQTQQVTVTASIPELMNLTIEGTAVNIAFTQSDYASDGTGSKLAINATTLRIASNTSWILQVQADSADFSYDGVTVPNKPCGDLAVSAFSTSTYLPVGIINTEIARGEPGGNSVAANNVPVSYKLNSTLVGDPPGNYTLTLTYTILAQ